ncbi:MAG: TIGR00266 family protein [Bacilli bacterium]|nr:TIGR00266 family protein [Bacilli bacterium]
MKYEIKGDSLPVVVCYPEEGEVLCTEKGAMCWMSGNIEMSTNARGGFGKALGRLFSGESIFLNEFVPVGGSGMIAFASSFPGSIIPYHVTPGNAIIVQKNGFMAMEKGLDLSIHFQRKLGAGFFGGEGFIMQKVSGDGLVFIEIDGHCEEKELAAGEKIIVDTGRLAAMTESCTMSVEAVKGVKNVLFGGEGFFNTIITGPGKVYLQSMPISNVAGVISRYIPSSN